VRAQRGIAIVEFGLLSHFADPVWLKIFSSGACCCIQITVKTKITRHCAPPRNYGLIAQFEEGTQLARKLHTTCIVRLADISFM
jgi:hypothetical protein